MVRWLLSVCALEQYDMFISIVYLGSPMFAFSSLPFNEVEKDRWRARVRNRSQSCDRFTFVVDELLQEEFLSPSFYELNPRSIDSVRPSRRLRLTMTHHDSKIRFTFPDDFESNTINDDERFVESNQCTIESTPWLCIHSMDGHMGETSFHLVKSDLFGCVVVLSGQDLRSTSQCLSFLQSSLEREFAPIDRWIGSLTFAHSEISKDTW